MASPADDAYLVSHFINKSVPFKFRGKEFIFDLSQGLFSSAGVDAGTSLLLSVFSKLIDEDKAAGRPLPRRVLDAGCGCGIIGICAAAALAQAQGDMLVRSQDRDELARLVTLHNAAKNNAAPLLEAFTEPLLAVNPGGAWDLILTNIPAKAGKPVLENFVRRSAQLLNPGGRVILVAVQTLADFFAEQISAAGLELLQRIHGSGYTVFAYGQKEPPKTPPPLPSNAGGSDFFARYPFYARAKAICRIEEINVSIDTVYGASGFDNPGGAVLAAAKLIRGMGPEKFLPVKELPLLIHEPAQGFFPCWLLEFLRQENQPSPAMPSSVMPPSAMPPIPPTLVLSGRNILALEAAKHNVEGLACGGARIVPAADLRLGTAALLEASSGKKYGCITAFPELLPQSSLPKNADQLSALWDSLPPLLAPGGIFIAAFGSSEAERFDRKKPAGYTRLGSVKRNGFRALAYRDRLKSD